MASPASWTARRSYHLPPGCPSSGFSLRNATAKVTEASSRPWVWVDLEHAGVWGLGREGPGGRTRTRVEHSRARQLEIITNYLQI